MTNIDKDESGNRSAHRLIGSEKLSHLRQLEAESIHIMREVAAQFDNPVMLYSIGKDSGAMLHVARKAFYPARIPFPLLHVDTTWKFSDMIKFRDSIAKKYDVDLLVHINQEGVKQGIGPISHGSKVHTDVMKTQGLLQALSKHGFDAAFGGARRDEERSRAKERIYSFRDRYGKWDPKNQRPELWNLYNGRINKGESIRVFPLSNWTELDIWLYTYLENIDIVPLYLAKKRPVVNRDGTLIMVDDDRLPLKAGETPMMKSVRFRTLGCYPLSGAIESEADTLPEIIKEMLLATQSERQGRLIDTDQDGSMEEKEEGRLFLMTAKITPENIQAYLKQHQEKELCRFVTVGSVDDGKSTLIGRLLHDTHGIYEDQLDAVKKATKQEGTEIDFSLFTDGLKAEREQGITIDVAYRYFSTEERKFIIADTPGHVQYTRNMATGASTANVAVILIDARLGILQQSRRHAYIASLLGIPHLAVCVNKMDLKNYEQGVFDAIQKEFSEFCKPLHFNEVKFIPISAVFGDNVVHASEKTPWYTGGTILEYLEKVPVQAAINKEDFRFPVQYVLRPNLNYRGFSGTIASGTVKKGDTLMTLPSGKKSKVLSIDTYDGELEEARAPMAVTIRLEDEIDSSRGDMLVKEDNLPLELQRFSAKVVWLSEQALDRGRSYLIKHTTQLARIDVEDVQFLVDLETLDEKPANRIEMNDIGQITISAHNKMFLDPYRKNIATGAFIIIDPISNNTVAAGMVVGPAPEQHKGLKLGAKLPESQLSVSDRETALGQKGATVLITGLPAAGKSEIAYELEKQLFALKKHALVIDPDDGIGRGAPLDGSSPVQTPEFALRLANTGLISIFTYAMPLRADRSALRDAVGRERFVEVFASASLEDCKKRDIRGLYGPNHPDPSYERPQEADVEADLSKMSEADAAQAIIAALKTKNLL